MVKLQYSNGNVKYCFCRERFIMDYSGMKAQFERAHTVAWDTVAEDKNLPKVDVLVLLTFLGDILVADSRERSDVITKYVYKYGPVFFAYGRILGEEFFTEIIQEALENSDREEFQNMAKDDVARCIVKCSESVFLILGAYFKKEITDEDLLVQISRVGIDDLVLKFLKGFGVDTAKLGVMLQLSGPILVYQGAMGAYREYRKALDDLQLAKESRQRVEEECRRSIEMIRRYRLQAEQRVSVYMNKHLDVFEAGFEAMDRAILANDIDGYIAGNVEIQKILGAEIQFTNQDEFEAFMESDEPFIF